MKKSKWSRKGFTLVEIIVALAILGIVAVSFISMFTFGFLNILTGNRTSTAHQAGQDSIEYEMGSPVLRLDTTNGEEIKPTTVSIEFPSVTFNVKGAAISFENAYEDTSRNERSAELVTFVPQAIFLSTYSLTLNDGESANIIVKAPGITLSSLEYIIVRPNGDYTKEYIGVSRVDGTDQITLTVTVKNTSSVESIIVVRTVDRQHSISCTVYN